MTAAGTEGPRTRAHPSDEQVRRLARTILTAPFQRQTWYELLFFVTSGIVAGISAFFVGATLFTGLPLSVVFVGVLILAGGLRGARGLGGWQRALAGHFLSEQLEDPEPFRSRPGFFGWLGSAFQDRAAWRALGYIVAKVPLVIFGSWFALRIWIEAVVSVIRALAGVGPTVHLGSVPGGLLLPDYGGNYPGSRARLLLLISGGALLLLAPWTMRLVIYVDRMLIRLLLGPDAIAARVRSLEESRARTVDTSAAILRGIERDLHDGTQAQLVALAMRLGQIKEKLASPGDPDLDAVRHLVDEAHLGAKEAIVELRDLARGIHPPVLDTGLESALTTLTARSPVPTELRVSIQSRPTPAIEAITYFCVAELLANVAQHAQASRASIACTELGPWLRIVVRDDGVGCATVNRVGSSSSGLAGLADRASSVDGHLSIASPPGGPTVVTLDLPLHA